MMQQASAEPLINAFHSTIKSTFNSYSATLNQQFLATEQDQVHEMQKRSCISLPSFPDMAFS